MNIKRLAVDLAKDVFQLYGVGEKGQKVLEKRLTSREKFTEFVVKLGSSCNYNGSLWQCKLLGKKIYRVWT